MPKLFLDIRHASKLSGYSLRHFQRKLERQGIKTFLVKQKMFMLVSDFKDWRRKEYG